MLVLVAELCCYRAESCERRNHPCVASFAGEQRVTVIRSPQSGANFLNLGEFETQFANARRSSLTALTSTRVGAAQRAAATQAAG